MFREGLQIGPYTWLKAHGKMPIEKAVETTIKILDGLEFLHSHNIIHRDLKLANILLQGETPRLATSSVRHLPLPFTDCLMRQINNGSCCCS